MEEKRCYGCMKLKNSGPVCQHCGFDETVQNASHQLPLGAVMQGKYRVGRVLGQGGFGITYLGWDEYLDVPVAIKEYYPSGMVMRDNAHSLSVVSSSGASGEKFSNDRERFLREAKSLARFKNDPQIVTVSNFFLENNTAYIVMEYVQGITLKQHIKNSGGKLSAEETFRLINPVMLALDRVHATGLIHRDISPDNIMLLPGGGVKLIDFGAVRDVQNAEADSPLSKSTESILKQGYAPIEQYQKRGALGPWTDVYALCATIYYCLTGQTPPDAPARVLGEEEFSWDTVSGLSPEQRKALDKGMAMLPRMRSQSMAQLHRELQEAPALILEPDPVPVDPVPDPDPEPEPAPGPKPKWWIPALAAAAVLAVVSIAGLALGQKPKTAEPLQMQETTLPAETVSPVTEAETLPAERIPEPWEKNVMKKIITWKDGFYYGVICGSDVSVKQIATVTFLDSTESAPSTSWDASEAGDGSVLAWVSGYDSAYDLYIAADGGINGKNTCNGLFWYFSNMTQVNFNGNFHTEQTTDMTSMFASCESLKEIDLRSLDTSHVTNMSNMFSFCSGLERIDLNYLDTSSVLNMSGMFSWCRNLKWVGLEEWDTSQVETMSAMFQRCITLEEMDLSSFDTSNVMSLGGMFCDCAMLLKVNLSSFDTSNVMDMSEMFYGCTRLHDPDLSNFDTSKVASFNNFMGDGKKANGKVWNQMFDPSVTAELWKYNVMKKSDDGEYFCDSGIKKSQIVSVTVYDDPGSNFTQDHTWYGDLSHRGDHCVTAWLRKAGQNTYDLYIDTIGGINGKLAAEGLFEGYTNLQTVRFNGAFRTDEAVSLRNMFAGCEKLSNVDFSGFNTENVTDMSGMFRGCKKLKNPNLSSFDFSKVTSFEHFMEEGTKVNGRNWEDLFTQDKRETVDTGWEKNVLKDFTGFSYGHQYSEAIADSDIEVTKIVSATFLDTLEDAPVSAWDVSEAGDGSVLAWVNGDGQKYDLFIGAEGGVNGKIACKELFNGYKNLKKVEFGGNFHTEQATDFSCMFADCRVLESLDLHTLDTSNATTMWAMFNNCRALKTLDLSRMDTSNVTDMGSMFSVGGWESLDLSGFDTSNVTSMEGMFSYSEKLTQLDLSGFDTANVTVMEHMFYHCTNLKTLDVSSFDTSNVTDMTGMFRECTSLKDPDLSHFDTGKVTKYEFFMEQGKKVNGQPWAYLFSK